MKQYAIIIVLLLTGCIATAQKIELRVPIGHTGVVQSVTMSADYRYMATAGADRALKIWSLAEGKQLRTLPLARSAKECRFDKDNQHIAVAMDGWEYWDAATGKREYQYLPEITYNADPGFTISRNAEKIAVAKKRFVEIRDVKNGNLLQQFNWLPADTVRFGLGYYALTEKWFAYCNKSQVLIYNLQQKKFIPVVATVDNDVYGIAVPGKGDVLFIMGYSSIYKIDLNTGKLLRAEYNVGGSYDAHLSEDDRYIVQGNRLFDTATLSQTTVVKVEGRDIRSYADARYYAAFNRETGSGSLFAMGGFNKIRDFENETAWLHRMKVSNADHELIFTTDLSEARVWDFDAYRFARTVKLDIEKEVPKPSEYDSYFSLGEYYLAATYSKRAVVNYHTGARLYVPDKKVVAISPDGQIGFTDESDEANVVELAAGNVIRKLDIKSPYYAVSPDNKTLLYYKYGEPTVHILNYRSNTETVAEIPMGERPVFNADGSKLYTFKSLHYQRWVPQELVITAMPSGAQLKTVPIKDLEGMRSAYFAVSADERYVAVLYSPAEEYYMVRGNMMVVYEINTGKEVCTATNVDGADEVAFYENKLVLVLSRVSNTVNIYDAKTCKHLLDITHFKGMNDWIAVTPEGFYDGNMESLKKFYFIKGNDIIDPDFYFEKFYSPGLFARIMHGEVFTPPADLKGIPKVKMSYAAVIRNLLVEDDIPTYQNTTGVAEITVEAVAPDDAVDEIRLFHNGKIITLSTRNLIVADDSKPSSAVKKYQVNLLPGQNIFRAVALNTQRTESKPDVVDVFYNNNTTDAGDVKPSAVTADGPLSQVERDATLHLVVVGINKYRNKKLNLNYAIADAASFREELEKDAATILSNVVTHFITDAAADRESIIKVFDSVKQAARSKDMFIFYYAGHGVIGADKEFYLVPSDVSDLNNVQSELEQKGIPAKLLQQYAIDIQAQKQLFVLDACQSAGAFESMLNNTSSQQKSIAVVARSTGTHWIAASGAQQFANEFSSLGHGAFTYVMLEALQGAAVNNKMITVNTLKNYLQKMVPLLMKKYHGTPQYPASYGFGSDFPVKIH